MAILESFDVLFNLFHLLSAHNVTSSTTLKAATTKYKLTHQASLPEKEEKTVLKAFAPNQLPVWQEAKRIKKKKKKIPANHKHKTSINTAQSTSLKNASYITNPTVWKSLFLLPKKEIKFKYLRCHETYP